MEIESIEVVGINQHEQLYIKPQIRQFTLIWRSASGIHWNGKESYLYAPKPKEWSYLDWYIHVVTFINSEYDCKLVLSENTVWADLPETLKVQIERFNSEFALLI